MNLSDDDILELNELCNALVDDTITERQQQKLSEWLASSAEAREFYVRTMGLSASLYHHAAEMQTGEPDPSAALPARAVTGAWRRLALLAVAACVGALVWINWPSGANERTTLPIATTGGSPTTTAANVVAADSEFVAQLTGSKESQWGAGVASLDLGGRLRKGQQLELANGFAEITFDSGARVVLHGPASLKVDSQWTATLTRGTLKANVPPQAAGFRVLNPAVEVLDLGTEFSMVIDDAGAAAEVLVLKGEVEAAPRGVADQQPIILREMESRRFGADGVSNVDDSEQKFRRLTQPVLLEHFTAPTGYAHWSFDAPGPAESLPADVYGMTLDPDSAALALAPDAAVKPALAPGRRGSALTFDGRRYASAAFPGMSATSPHTVVFWVKVPADANLLNAYAMVAWGAINKNFGTHPFQITWNRNANEGTIGALRTDYGKGYALGATPLRDGRWHHIAVVFVPRDDPERPIEVKQYVDGRLEGEGRPSPPGSDIFMNPSNPSRTSGTIWLGCRLGPKGVRGERFYGALDELFIADSALQPHEIVRLMNANQLD